MYTELSIILISNTTTIKESNIKQYNHYVGKFSTFHAWHHFTVYLSGAGIFIQRSYIIILTNRSHFGTAIIYIYMKVDNCLVFVIHLTMSELHDVVWR